MIVKKIDLVDQNLLVRIEYVKHMLEVHVTNYTSTINANKYSPAVIGFTPHRSLPNIEDPQSPSPMAIFVMFAPNGGSPCDGSRAPGVRKTLVVFLRFFHLARRF